MKRRRGLIHKIFLAHWLNTSNVTSKHSYPKLPIANYSSSQAADWDQLSAIVVYWKYGPGLVRWLVAGGGGAIIQVAKPRCALCRLCCAGLLWNIRARQDTGEHMGTWQGQDSKEGGHMKLMWGDIMLGDLTLHLHRPGLGNRWSQSACCLKYLVGILQNGNHSADT